MAAIRVKAAIATAMAGGVVDWAGLRKGERLLVRQVLGSLGR